MAGYGYVLGELFCYSILYEFTKDLEPKSGFAIATAVSVILTIVLFFIIKEPSHFHHPSQKEKKLF